jgi:hypothetical protein
MDEVTFVQTRKDFTFRGESTDAAFEAVRSVEGEALPGLRRAWIPSGKSLAVLFFIFLSTCADEDQELKRTGRQAELSPGKPARANSEEGAPVRVILGKSEYRPGENITLILKNTAQESVFSHMGSGTPVFSIAHIEERSGNSTWKRKNVYIQRPDVEYDSDAPAELKPGQTVKLEWRPLVYFKGRSEAAWIDPGYYRIAVSYQDKHREEWKHVFTKGFTVR